jgi:hypothetical protein
MTAPPTTGLPGDRVIRGTLAQWTAPKGWFDRDGMPVPETMLVIGYTIVLQHWKNNKVEYKTEQPLPDPAALNDAIPPADWEIGRDGKPRKPWEHAYVVYMVDLKTGALYTYKNTTYGAMLAYTALEEQIAVYRMLCGEHVFPIVHLEKRYWKSATYGLVPRAHFQIVEWRKPGGAMVESPSPTPQLTGPLAVTPPTAPAPTPTPATAPASTTAAPAAPAASTKSPIIDATKPASKPMAAAEMMADEIPWK